MATYNTWGWIVPIQWFGNGSSDDRTLDLNVRAAGVQTGATAINLVVDDTNSDDRTFETLGGTYTDSVSVDGGSTFSIIEETHVNNIVFSFSGGTTQYVLSGQLIALENNTIVVIPRVPGDASVLPPDTGPDIILNGSETLDISWSATPLSDPGNDFIGIINFVLELGSIACFASDSLIKTPLGAQKISDIKVGTRVTSKDGQDSKVRWIGTNKITAHQLKANPKLRPVRIEKGALGNGLPERDLLVSRQHRMLVSSAIAKSMFGGDVLVSAIKLTALPGIYVDESVEEIEYVHLLFDKHEIIYAEGAASESLYTGPEALKAISQEAREEVLTLFSELADRYYRPEPAATIPSNKKQKELVAQMASARA